jgi:hypothetical protein
MTDTPKHIADLHLRLWLQKPIEERLYQTIRDIEQMREALREIKRNMGLPLGDLDPVGQYLQKMKEK